MTLGKILQKLKDLYGWDKGNLYYWKDKRAYYRALAEGQKRKMNETKNEKVFNRTKFMYEQYIAEFDRFDFMVRNSDHDSTEDNWREKN